MHWKINRDYYYKDLYSLLGNKGIEEAGYFEDSANIDLDLKKSCSILCTPIAPIVANLKAATKPCVLITTGSFCPIHQGHLDMMDVARKTVEEAGYNVLAGYISAGHDEYINSKVKEKAIPIHHRIVLIQKIIEQNGFQDWLMADPWEGIFAQVAVNFTDVVYRLELYLEHLLQQKIPVFFVCGGDNARFALTFMQKGYCVVVGRPSYESRFEDYKQQLASCTNILWTEGDNELSSTKIRAKDRYKPAPKKDLYLRVEGEDEREAAVTELLKPYFSNLHLAHVSEQRQIYQKISHVDTISLDAYIPSRFNLKLSRVYDLMGLHQLGYINRPGSLRFEEQISEIPVGNYCLFDDDIHSGNTMKFAQALLEKNNRKVLAIVALNLYQKKQANDSEVLDCRDFLVGNFQSGLVLELNGQVVRAPYVYPYVCPYARASISNPLTFSINIWQLNLDYYLKYPLLLKDCSPHIQHLFLTIGFDTATSLVDICQWHVDLLNCL